MVGLLVLLTLSVVPYTILRRMPSGRLVLATVLITVVLTVIPIAVALMCGYKHAPRDYYRL